MSNKTFTPPEGFHNAVIANVTKKEFTTAKGTKFEKIMIECVVDGFKRSLFASMGVDFAIKYFSFCNIKGSELAKKPCFVSLIDESYIDSNGEPRKATKIKFLNMINDEGKPIRLPPQNVKTVEELPF